MKKAVITKVSMQIVGQWYVQYESGAHRTYKDGKLPKTAQAWLTEHPEYQRAANWAMDYDRKCNDDLEVMMAVSGKGRGAGKDYADRIRKMRKATAILVAEKAGMSTIGYVTKKMAVEYLLAA